MGEAKDLSPTAEAINKAADGLGKLKAFWKTKAAIKSGTPIYDWSEAQLKEEGYLGPWSFNAIETAIATAPSLLCIKALNLLFGKADDPSVGSLFEATKDETFIRTFNSVFESIELVTIPLLLTATVILIGWGALYSKDSTTEMRVRARKAYLYYDGSYGLLLQMILTLLSGVLTWVKGHHNIEIFTNTVLIQIFLIIFAIAAILQIRLVGLKIPRLLFELNGYSARRKHFWQKKLPDDPPWTKYTCAVFIGGWPVFIAIHLTVFGVSWAVAWVVDTIKLVVLG